MGFKNLNLHQESGPAVPLTGNQVRRMAVIQVDTGFLPFCRRFAGAGTGLANIPFFHGIKTGLNTVFHGGQSR